VIIDANALANDPVESLKAAVTDQTQEAADLLAFWLEQDQTAAG